MGLWGTIFAHSAGSLEQITCKTCGDVYRGNIDKRFPYAACGKCLENAKYEANRSGNDEMYSLICWELRRRANLI